MTNKYDAFTGLANSAAHASNFLDVTAERSKAGELSPQEYANRLTDVATILRDATAKASEVFFTPDK